MATEFLNPYEAKKVLSGVLKAMPIKRPNWVQSFFRDLPPTNKKTVNFDQEYGTKNVMGQFVSPKVDADFVKLPTFGHKELVFSYSKEGIDSDEFDELDVRQLGDELGQVDIAKNKAARFIQKVALAEQRFENLFEYVGTSIWLYGGYVAKSEKHPEFIYNFGRTVATIWSQIKGANALDLIPSVNLTTAAVTAPWGGTLMPVVATNGGDYTAGEKAWTRALVTAGTSHPVEDLTKMVQTCNERGTASAIHMSDDAYDAFNFDVTTNYKDAATTTIQTIQNVTLDVVPQLKAVKGLTFRRMWTFASGISIPIYTYNGTYNDRTTGTETKYIGSGWVVVIPDSDGVKVHGRIMHPRANWNAMPRWMNYWEHPKTGEEEWEIHTSFIMGHLNIDALVAWKVV